MNRWSAVAALGCVGALSCGTSYAAWSAPADSFPLAADRPSATPVEPGLYAVEIDTPGWFRVERTVDDSTIWVGESIVAPTSTVPEHYLAMTNRSGKDCEGVGDGAVGVYLFDHRLRGGTVSSGNCTGDTVWVEHSFGTAPDYAGDPATVAVWEEPPVWDDLPEAGLSVPWSNEAPASRGGAELGSSFAEAPVLADGSYTVQVEAGEPAVLKVPLDWNQHVQIVLHQSGRVLSGRQVVTPRLYNPLGGRVDWATPTVSPSVTVLPDYDYLALNVEGATGGVVSPTVRFRNREEGSAAALAGDYYVSLEVEDNADMPDGADVVMEVLVGTDGPVAAPYKSEPEPLPDLAAGESVDEPSGEPSEEPGDEKTAEPVESAGAGDDGARPWPAAIGLLAGSLVLAVAGAVLLGRWRRA